jgi:chemotaxis protein CheD
MTPHRKEFLYPGQSFVSASPAMVTTILGPCVAVYLWNPKLGAGALNHFLLPHGRPGISDPYRFGDLAVPLLIKDLLALGGQRSDLQAKIFGGAYVLRAASPNGKHIGQQNVEVARAGLAQAGIPIVAEDVGGRWGRKIIFHTDQGLAKVKYLRGPDNEADRT